MKRARGPANTSDVAASATWAASSPRGPTPRLEAPPLPTRFWIALALVVAFTAWCAYLITVVSHERAEVEARVGWMVEAQSLRGALDPPRAPSRLELVRQLATLDGELAAHAAPPLELREILREAVTALERSTAAKLDPGERAAIAGALDRFVNAARVETRDVSRRLGQRWTSLYLVALAAIIFGVIVLALLVLADRRRRRAEQLSEALERSLVDVERARANATRAYAAKSQFLASMSHELRTPLNGVLGSAHLLLAGELDEELRAHASTIVECGEQLLERIQNILDFAELTRAGANITMRAFDLEEQILGATAALFDLAARKGLRASIALAPELPARVYGDPGRLHQLLVATIDNAIKFTRAGSVELHVRPAGEARVRFEVIDTGIGLDPDRLSALLEPFAREDTTAMGSIGGAGLGLA
ncbi:MAG: hypothetical protein KC468_39360, partial [Myxococcales bacterium]|nr:hypothetical protein [Myxococcales bacterium]